MTLIISVMVKYGNQQHKYIAAMLANTMIHFRSLLFFFCNRLLSCREGLFLPLTALNMTVYAYTMKTYGNKNTITRHEAECMTPQSCEVAFLQAN